ncbi:MAG: hypothetical protein F4056_02190, partial [Chloroflexi bacterium]|nr:hypothetical protein [Chloroflexota bacterium]
MIDRLRKIPLVRVAVFAAALIALLAAACGDGAPSKDEPDAYTKHVVQEALDRYEDDGRQAVVDYYNTAESIDGQWYVFILDEDAVIISHAPTPADIGRSLYDDLGVDVTGYAFGPHMAAATESGRWISYVYLNPQSGAAETKHSWVVRRDGLYFGSGWYEVTPGAAETPHSRAQPDVNTRYFEQQALDRLEAE